MATFDMGIDDILPSSQSSEMDEDEMNKMEKSAVPANTSRATKSGIKKFFEWCRKRHESTSYAKAKKSLDSNSRKTSANYQPPTNQLFSPS